MYKHKTKFLNQPAQRHIWAIMILLTGLAIRQDASADMALEGGETIAFMGDSITQAGHNRKNGYVNLVIEALNHEGLNVQKIGAGISGNKSSNMLARLDRDVLSKDPDWMTLSCGVNDVWHFKLVLGDRSFEGIPLPEYKKNITEIIDRAQKADIKVMILTSTMIGEDQSKALNQMLIPYNDFLREIAEAKGCLLADLNKDMQAALQKIPDEPGKPRTFGKYFYGGDLKNKLTTDGCHMNKRGNIMMAKGVLRAFGMDKAAIAAAEERWRQ
jgi:lysophospholipase L1-like esterase